LPPLLALFCAIYLSHHLKTVQAESVSRTEPNHHSYSRPPQEEPQAFTQGSMNGYKRRRFACQTQNAAHLKRGVYGEMFSGR
ncbi:hypothetical protein OSTOST_08563, partial [Ostertagia ostertagi]